MSVLYWEDFEVGGPEEIGRHTFEAADIIAFARQFDPQPFHLDAEAAKRSAFGGLVASGWHTCSVGMRLICDSYVNRTLSMGSPGLDNIRWPNPVRAGDTVTYYRSFVEKRASASRPGMGLIKTRWEAKNQRGEPVLTMEGWGMFGRRP